MTIYLFIFFLSVSLFYIASRINIKPLHYTSLLVALFFPIVLAGLRDLNIGIDIFVYGYSIWNDACSYNSWSSFYMNYSDTSMEVGYLMLNFIVSRITNDIHIFFAVHAFLLMLFTVLTAKKIKESSLLWFLPLFYFLYSYNEYLNILRQSLAVMICLYVSTFLFEKKILYFYLGCFLCYFFHHSAAFMFLLYPIMILINKFNNRKVMLALIIIIATLLLFSVFQLLMSSLFTYGLANDKYEMYIGVGQNSSHKIDLVFLGSIILILLLFVKKNNRRFPAFDYTIFFALIGIALTLMGSLVEVANRVSYYVVFPLSYMMLLSIKDSQSKQNVRLLVIALLVFRFIYLAITTQIGGTIPYHSTIYELL